MGAEERGKVGAILVRRERAKPPMSDSEGA
jgi:hypothetical protein